MTDIDTPTNTDTFNKNTDTQPHNISESVPPMIVAGPILRRLLPNQLVLWIFTTDSRSWNLSLFEPGSDTAFLSRDLIAHTETNNSHPEHTQIQVGTHGFIHFINVHFDQPLPEDTVIEYDLNSRSLNKKNNNDNKNNHNEREEKTAYSISLTKELPHLSYLEQNNSVNKSTTGRPSFIIKTTLSDVVHGSCRKPHFKGDDNLLQADCLIERSFKSDDNASSRPDLLLMTGDQIYADDVAGPTLVAIHQVIQRLGLYNEQWEGATINDSTSLFSSPECYYRRDTLLPKTHENRDLYERFYKGARKPIFTSVYAKNHLITLSEVLAMYLLVWSPVPWQWVDLDNTALTEPSTEEEIQQLYAKEKAVIERFVEGLPQVQRAMAHLPVYMIFDDHDITDDWNLHRAWEESAYGNPFSKRIIGNALIGYWLMQGWGNHPEAFSLETTESVLNLFQHHQTPHYKNHDDLIDHLLAIQEWDYTVPTFPKLVVLDTRTNRWRSESNAEKPSGLMDWEMLSKLQQELIHEESVIMVSAAPIFGVKFIETIQKIFTFLGQALVVDAESWMAHPGTANVILNIFRHPKTPQHFIILSGDVHYSFAYNVKIRFSKSSPSIWQITCSGLKNRFPDKLLTVFDYLDRVLYASQSPLNWFTKRRSMKIKARKPISLSQQEQKPTAGHLLNTGGLGRVRINTEGEHRGRPESITVLHGENKEEIFQ
ncbi:alkaline phosphatase D family protein [Marinibactrum halimedae]|uniref:Alkaline phosphatase family protein n=1 Tax=Marinibactrum halimedae TaxID=1444977 RepID=A0AA37WNN1_9GAMM|nr:alkaline phosphatase D family protein [Marinibactrum halimedae]MCD9459968.1 alkaline phosphatase family protein [Marinibactrum halimedae]GLS28264.1 hypothetical protein GCM10007877_39830 [Marinibactrum halimedae]